MHKSAPNLMDSFSDGVKAMNLEGHKSSELVSSCELYKVTEAQPDIKSQTITDTFLGDGGSTENLLVNQNPDQVSSQFDAGEKKIESLEEEEDTQSTATQLEDTLDDKHFSTTADMPKITSYSEEDQRITSSAV